MLKLIVLSVAVAAVWGLPRAGTPSFEKFGMPVPSGRIIGGHDADIADYPYHLIFTYNGTFHCGAARIGRKWALTAAHCTYPFQPFEVQVIAGTSSLTGGQTVNVTKFYQHPKYSVNTIDYDISILRLAQAITVANSAPIALHRAGYTAKGGTDVTITGHGILTETGPFPTSLQVVVTKVIGNKVCNESYEGILPVTGRMACSGNLEDGGAGSCKYDSGGPVVVNGKLYGMVSWALGCARPGYPNVNSKISEPSLRRYIRRITGL